MFDLGWRTWAGIGGGVTLVAVLQWLLGIIPWWGVLIAIPVATFVLGAALLVVGILLWMAGGSH